MELLFCLYRSLLKQLQALLYSLFPYIGFSRVYRLFSSIIYRTNSGIVIGFLTIGSPPPLLDNNRTAITSNTSGCFVLLTYLYAHKKLFLHYLISLGTKQKLLPNRIISPRSKQLPRNLFLENISLGLQHSWELKFTILTTCSYYTIPLSIHRIHSTISSRARPEIRRDMTSLSPGFLNNKSQGIPTGTLESQQAI